MPSKKILFVISFLTSFYGHAQNAELKSLSYFYILNGSTVQGFYKDTVGLDGAFIQYKRLVFEVTYPASPNTIPVEIRVPLVKESVRDSRMVEGKYENGKPVGEWTKYEVTSNEWSGCYGESLPAHVTYKEDTVTMVEAYYWCDAAVINYVNDSTTLYGEISFYNPRDSALVDFKCADGTCLYWLRSNKKMTFTTPIAYFEDTRFTIRNSGSFREAKEMTEDMINYFKEKKQ